MGHTLGFPTLNLPWQPELKPRFGVYAVTVEGAKGGAIQGVANFGVRPTVETAGTVTPLLEVHLLEASALTTGDRISVQWRQFLRPEAKFSGLDELRRQIQRDCDTARAFFTAGGAT
jgi:riboflavin kinase/FMN adenylyltransferase